MGADLSGFIMIGPVKIERTKKMVKETADYLIGLAKIVEKLDLSPLEKEDFDDGSFVLPDGLAEIGDIDGDCNETLLETLEKVKTFKDRAKAEAQVEEFVAMWNGETYRDMASRNYPADKTKKIVFCGEMSWGDGPEEGSAQYVCREAFKFGIPELVGVD